LLLLIWGVALPVGHLWKKLYMTADPVVVVVVVVLVVLLFADALPDPSVTACDCSSALAVPLLCGTLSRECITWAGVSCHYHWQFKQLDACTAPPPVLPHLCRCGTTGGLMDEAWPSAAVGILVYIMVLWR